MKKVAIALAILSTLTLSVTANAAVNGQAVQERGSIAGKAGVITGTSSGTIVGNGVRLRKEPGLSSRTIMQLYKDDCVSIYANDPVWKDGYKWICVQAHPSGKVGWVAAKYVYSEGEIQG